MMKSSWDKTFSFQAHVEGESGVNTSIGEKNVEEKRKTYNLIYDDEN